MFQKSYGTARGVLGFMSVAGWILCGIGVIAAIAALSDMDRMGPVLVLSAVITAAAGLFLVASAQVSYAILDQADISRASLGILKEMAEARGVSVEQVMAPPAGAVPAPARKEPQVGAQAAVRADGTEVREYMGKEITKKGGRYYVGGYEFINLGKAKAAIKEGRV